MTNTTTILLGFGLAVGAVSVGVWAAKGSRGLHASGHKGMHGARRRRGRGQLRGHTEQTELKIFIDNDADLYRGQTTSILKNLITKKAKGVYDKSKAEKLWMYLVESGAKKYAKESGDGGTWHKMFSMEDRKQVARDLNNEFLTEAGYGNYDNLLPKKYQGKRA